MKGSRFSEVCKDFLAIVVFAAIAGVILYAVHLIEWLDSYLKYGR